jgi:N-dimethylarginine dimethylaminohydrolase
MTAPFGTFGVRSMIAPLRSVALRIPTTIGDFAAAGWRPPDPVRLLAQHERLGELLAALGAGVVVLQPLDGLVDACFVFDPVLMTAAGAVVLRSAKAVRAGEPAVLAADLKALGVPLAGQLGGAAVADCGDLLWLDEQTLLAGRGYRTNAEAHRQLATILADEGAVLERCDLPHDRGPGNVLHLMSVVSPVAEDLAVVFEPLAPVPLLEALRERSIRWLAIDPEEYATLGANVLAVRPGVVVLADGNPRTRRALEAEGCEVHVYQASELSKGDGGPTCLTRPLHRREQPGGTAG